jgi:hypothetical protein
MRSTKLLMAIITVLAFSASLATAAPHSKGYTTATAHQAKFQISY